MCVCVCARACGVYVFAHVCVCVCVLDVVCSMCYVLTKVVALPQLSGGASGASLRDIQ